MNEYSKISRALKRLDLNVFSIGGLYESLNISGMRNACIYLRITLFHLAQSRLFVRRILTYIDRTSFDISFNCLIRYSVLL
jgi:hypothetical protein